MGRILRAEGSSGTSPGLHRAIRRPPKNHERTEGGMRPSTNLRERAVRASAKSRKLLFPDRARWGIVACGPALGPGRSGRGATVAVGYSGRRSLTERTPSRQPAPVLCTGLADHTAAQLPADGDGWLGAGWPHGPRSCAVGGSRPLCPRAVVCCPVPPCALLALGGTTSEHRTGWTCPVVVHAVVWLELCGADCLQSVASVCARGRAEPCKAQPIAPLRYDRGGRWLAAPLGLG